MVLCGPRWLLRRRPPPRPSPSGTSGPTARPTSPRLLRTRPSPPSGTSGPTPHPASPRVLRTRPSRPRRVDRVRPRALYEPRRIQPRSRRRFVPLHGSRWLVRRPRLRPQPRLQPRPSRVSGPTARPAPPRLLRTRPLRPRLVDRVRFRALHEPRRILRRPRPPVQLRPRLPVSHQPPTRLASPPNSRRQHTTIPPHRRTHRRL